MSASPARPGLTWIGIVVALLGASFIGQIVMLVVATSDPAFAVEPDYERKARDWDTEQRQRSTNEKLGWQIELRTTPAGVDRGVAVTLGLADRDGEPLPGAAVNVEAFHNARANRVLRATLPETEPGRYAARLPATRSGVWEFRLDVTRGDTRFTKRIRKDVLVERRGP